MATKKIGLRLVLAWIFSIIFIIASIGAFTSSILSGFLMLVAGIIILPPFSKMLKEKANLEFSTWLKIGIIIGLFILSSVFLTITEVAEEINDGSANVVNQDYSESMSDLSLDLKEIMQKYSSTSYKVGEGIITPTQSIELYEIYKNQLQEIKNKMNLLVPDAGYESIHQHNLNAVNLLIEACDLVIKGLNENNVALIYDATDNINEATTEISTAIELINSKS